MIVPTLPNTCMIKLISDRGTVLGSLLIPNIFADKLLKDGMVEIGCREKIGDAPERVIWAVLRESATVAGGVELTGMSIERFELMPSCAFFPGAAYIKSMMDGAPISPPAPPPPPIPQKPIAKGA